MGGTILMSSTSANPVCTPVFSAKSIYCAINSGCRASLSPFSAFLLSCFGLELINFLSASSPREVFTSTLIIQFIQFNSLTTIPTGEKYTWYHL